jgi:hypothetical protein
VTTSFPVLLLPEQLHVRGLPVSCFKKALTPFFNRAAPDIPLFSLFMVTAPGITNPDAAYSPG